MKQRFKCMAAAVLAWVAVATSHGISVHAANVPSADDFYAGKTVKLVIGTGVGGEYGLYAQLIARHLPRYVKGKPTFVVESMPGAGGRRAHNYLAKVAPRDGTVLSVPFANVVSDGLLSDDVQFDPAGFQWIGRIKDQLLVGVVWSKRSKVNTLSDATVRELVAGSVGATTSTAINPRLLNLIVGTRFKVVTGYRGTNDVQIAWERGEVDLLQTPWDTVLDRFSDRIASGDVVPIYAFGNKAVPGFENVRLIGEVLGRNDIEKAFLKIYASSSFIGRSLMAPPGVPSERVTLLRSAFGRMLSDTAFKMEAEKDRTRLSPMGGAELGSAIAEILNYPTRHVTQAREFYRRLLVQTN